MVRLSLLDSTPHMLTAQLIQGRWCTPHYFSLVAVNTDPILVRPIQACIILTVRTLKNTSKNTY